ncbi:hypothetical protein BOH78_4514 [Pichia kudriavzevii]|uniref:Uncharacterized protein n=1 Tax=Pichia kudriavzevii TaxID=4909 RepID=A0A1V2LGY9_PICKU|nr:hypothetical protein BOH78_4514 [Pichia kudriavzevii]
MVLYSYICIWSCYTISFSGIILC